MTNIEVSRTVVVVDILEVCSRNLGCLGPEYVAQFIQCLRISVIGIERKSVGETLAKSQVQGVVVGTVEVSSSIIAVNGRIGTYRGTGTRGAAIVSVAVQNADQLATERADIVCLQGKVFGQFILSPKVVLLVVRSYQVLVYVARNRLR